MNPKKLKDDIVSWIRQFFEENGKDCNAVVGISGGKDSTVVAALCVAALGKDRVFGVLLPQGIQSDIADSYAVVEHLGIKHKTINIGPIVEQALLQMYLAGDMAISEQTRINLPARIRMSMLYAVSQSCNGRVANTSNLSEDWVGYATRYGDSVGDFSPLSMLTVTEVRAIGAELGLPDYLVNKVPADGLTNHSDEANLGFSYEVLDEYIRTGLCPDPTAKETIDQKHIKNKFKLLPMPYFPYLCSN